MNIVLGQNGALTAALLIGGLVASDRRALAGGALIMNTKRKLEACPLRTHLTNN